MKQESITNIEPSQSSSANENHTTSVRDKLIHINSSIKVEWVIGVILLVIALCINFWKLGAPSVWFDEAFSMGVVDQPFPVFWNIIFGREPNMELYYIFLYGWVRLVAFFGIHQTEFVIRFPSAVLTTITPLVIFLFGRRYLGLLAGTLAAFLYEVNILQLAYGLQARSYCMQLLLICISWYALLAALSGERHQHRWWICYTIATTLMIYAHLVSITIFGAQVVAFLGIVLMPNAWRERARKRTWAFGVSIIAFVILIIPMINIARGGSRTGWLPVPHLSDVYKVLLSVAGNNNTYSRLLYACVAVSILIITISYILHYLPKIRQSLFSYSISAKTIFTQEQYTPVIWSLLCWLIVTITISFIISQGQTRMFSSRYLTIIVAPICLMASLGISLLRNRGVQIILALELIVLAGALVPQHYRSAQVEDWNSTSQWLVQHYKSGDGLVCYDNWQGCQVSMEYYLLHVYPESGARFTPDSPGYFNWATYGDNFPATDATNPQKLAAYGKKHAHIFFIVARLSSENTVENARNAQKWLDEHYRLVGEIKTPTVNVRLYNTGSGPRQ